jgi:hypothetical protein
MSGLSTPTRPWPRGRGAKCSCGGDLLPDIRVVVRFDFRYRDRPERAWLLIENGDAELYAFDPGPKEDAIVTIHDPLTFARWHLGHISWATALRSGGVSISGLCELVQSLPTWNRRPEIGRQLEREDKRTDFYGKRSSVLIIDPHQHPPRTRHRRQLAFPGPSTTCFPPQRN